MSHLEIKHLKMVSSIARTGNMTRAAQLLFVTQSALSQQLKDVENRLNTELFYRTRKKMILTPIGKKILETAECVIGQVEDMELEIAKAVSGESGELKVGTQCIFCYKWLPGVLRHFQDKFPGIEFEIGSSRDVEKELEEKKFDLVITAGREFKPHFESRPLFKDQMVCIVPENHPLSAAPYIRWEDFDNECLLSHSDKDSNRFYQDILKPMGIEPRRLMCLEQPQAMIEMAAAGFGISMFPRWAVEHSLKEFDIKALPITAAGIPVTWSATYMKVQDVPGYQEEFIRCVSRMHLAGAQILA